MVVPNNKLMKIELVSLIKTYSSKSKSTPDSFKRNLKGSVINPIKEAKTTNGSGKRVKARSVNNPYKKTKGDNNILMHFLFII